MMMNMNKFKKTLSLILAFLIISAAVTGLVYLLGYILDRPSIYADGNAVTFGFASGLAGLLGPIIAALISKLFSKK